MDADINLNALALVKGSRLGTQRMASAADGCVGGGGKRLMDLTLAATGLLFLSILMVLIAALVRLTMGGPVIFRHVRVGQGGLPFECLKFRTMVADSEAVLARHLAADPAAAEEWARTRKLKKDPRVTWLGRALRSSSLDELPQLINILKGDMSCVGPRPIVAEELELYGNDAAKYLAARPGLTGLWQVSGRSTLTYAERVALDADYVNRWSIWSDVGIIARTVPAMLKSHQTS